MNAPSAPSLGTANPTAPTRRQGWVVVIGLAVVLCVNFGVTLNSLSAFTTPVIADLNCSNEEAARLATLFLLAMTVTMPLAGWLLDHLPPRLIMVTGAAMTAVGYLYGSQAADIGSLTVGMALSGAGIGASTYVPAIVLAAHWIKPSRQGFAFGILLAGSAMGAIIFPMLLTQITSLYGWRSALGSAAILILAVCVPLLLRLARLPDGDTTFAQQGEAELSGHGLAKALGIPRYWLWILMMTLITLSSLGIYVALIPFLISAGYSAQNAAGFFAGVGLATLVGSFSFGALSNRWGAKPVLLLGTLIGSAGILCLLKAADPGFGILAVVVFCLTWGTTFNLVNQFSPVLLVESMGPRNFGSLLGIGNLISGVGASLGPEMVGHLFDSTHSYDTALLLCAALMAAGMLPMALMARQHAH